MGVGLLVLAAGAGIYGIAGWRVRQALGEVPGNQSPLSYAPLPVPAMELERWGGGEVEALAVSSASLLTAGGFGIQDETGAMGAGLPTLKASALALWRGRPVVALAAGGLFLRREGGWEAIRAGFGTLHIRTLQETPGGELLIGAQEGLFRAAWGASAMERLDSAPVRSLAQGAGGLLLAGGETGLRRIEGGRSQPIATPDPWVDFVGLRGNDLVVNTPRGLASGPLGGALQPLAGGQEATDAAVLGDQIFGVARGRLVRFDPSGRAAEEYLPSPPRRVFAASGLLFADTPEGLFRKTKEGWTRARPRAAGLPPGSSHVAALGIQQGRLILGLFDGGLAVGTSQGASLSFTPVPDRTAWGVNALLPSGGALYVASLRGAARFDGRRIQPLASAGKGGAYALALGREGVAIGTGQGVLLGDGRFLSAFHGLPGNQALALASRGEVLFVGTPSGLGAVSRAKVLWRAAGGDGRLPHPWVTALAFHRDDLFVGTYGGGVTRRTAHPQQEEGPGTFRAFLETEGWKVNTGCLLNVGGRLFLGTDGRGLHVLSPDGSRFVPVEVPLPSPRVTALLGEGDWLYIGTDEGLTRIRLSTLSQGI